MRVWTFGLLALAVALGAAAGATAAKKPWKPTATTCAKYVSPAWVEKETGVVGTPQKKPAGECHFIVDGQKDAFQVVTFQMGTKKKALALLQLSWKDLSTGTDTTTEWVKGLGAKALLVDGPLSGAYVVRGSEFFDLQWFAPITLTHAQSTATLRALLARIPT